MRIFLEKKCKKSPQRRGAKPPNPCCPPTAAPRWSPQLSSSGAPDPRVVTPAYYYNFVKFICSTKCGLLPSRTIFASSKFLHLFFTSNFVVFIDRGRNNISCPRAQGTLAMPLPSLDRALGLLHCEYQLSILSSAKSFIFGGHFGGSSFQRPPNLVKLFVLQTFSDIENLNLLCSAIQNFYFRKPF